MKFLVTGQDFGVSNSIDPQFFCVKESENQTSILCDVIKEITCNFYPDGMDFNWENVNEINKFLNNILNFVDNDIMVTAIFQLEPFEVVFCKTDVEERKTIRE